MARRGREAALKRAREVARKEKQEAKREKKLAEPEEAVVAVDEEALMEEFARLSARFADETISAGEYAAEKERIFSQLGLDPG
jgi:hypothetical protein